MFLWGNGITGRKVPAGGIGSAGCRNVFGGEGLAPEGTDDAEEEAGDEEGDEDVERLGGEERPEEGAVLAGDDVFEAGLQADADEGEAEEEVAEGFGDGGFEGFAGGVGVEGSVHLAEAEGKGGGDGAFDDDGVLVGEVADDGAGGCHAAGGVDGAAYPCAGDFLADDGVVEEEGQDEVGKPGHEVDHGHDDDEDEGDDVGEFAVVASGYACGGDAGGYAADGYAAGEYHGGAAVDAEAAGDKVGEEPDDADNEDGLEEPDGAGFHDIAEEDGGAEADDADFDEVFTLDGGFEPGGYVEEVADEEPEEDGEEYGFEAVVGDGGYFGYELGEEGDGEYGEEGEGDATEGFAEEEPSGSKGGEDEEVEEEGVVPAGGGEEVFGDLREPRGDEGCEEEKDGADCGDYPVFGAELLCPVFHVSVVF